MMDISESQKITDSVVDASRYDTEEKRKRHAEYQKQWRKENAQKAKDIATKSRRNEIKDPKRNEQRKRRIKANRQKPEIKMILYLQKIQRYKKTENAINSNRRWSDIEIEMAFNRDLTDAEIAAELGRSEQAIGAARIRYAERAPLGWALKGGWQHQPPSENDVDSTESFATIPNPIV